MDYRNEPKFHPALTKEETKEFPRVKLDAPTDIAEYYEGEKQQSVFYDPDAKALEYSEDYITWLEELAFKQLTK